MQSYSFSHPNPTWAVTMSITQGLQEKSRAKHHTHFSHGAPGVAEMAQSGQNARSCFGSQCLEGKQGTEFLGKQFFMGICRNVFRVLQRKAEGSFH